MSTPLNVTGLQKSFGDVTAVSDVTLELESGEIYGFLGPNGAGKTTTINLITGQLQPDGGEMAVFDTDPTENPLQVRSDIGILPERESPPSFRTPKEYFDFVANIRDIYADVVAERIEAWADMLAFHDHLDTMNTDLSRGQQQKVMIIQAFLDEPELIVIDEPLINLDPIMQERMKSYFQEYRNNGNTILLSTHDIHVAAEICDRVGIIQDGELVAELEGDNVRHEQVLKHFTDDALDT
jgi:ABC-2 type transport system ATP-binding protein